MRKDFRTDECCYTCQHNRNNFADDFACNCEFTEKNNTAQDARCGDYEIYESKFD